MDVSIIIVNYNTLKMTNECIESVFEQTQGIEFEVILVDNASTDGSKEFFSEKDNIIYIYNDENVGFGRANNIGFAVASGKYLFLLNSDTLLRNNAVKIFFDYMENASQDIACCGCLLCDKEGKVIHSYGNYHTLTNCIIEHCKPVRGILRRLHIRYYKYDDPKCLENDSNKVEFITGADLFVRKSVAITHGLFDPDFFMYSEDMEIQERYRNFGYYSVIVPGPKIVHLVGKSYKKDSIKKKELCLNSLFLYIKKSRSICCYLSFLIVFKIFYIISVCRLGMSIREKVYHALNVLVMTPKKNPH